MIAGGSFISTGDEATVHARFHFRPHFFQHAGMRVATYGSAALDGQDRLGAVVHLGNEAEVNGEIASSFGQETNSFEDLDALVDKYVARRVDAHELARAHSQTQRALRGWLLSRGFQSYARSSLRKVVVVDFASATN